MSNTPWDVRPYHPDDKAFIMATFLRGLYYGDSWFSTIPKDIFMNNYKKVGEALLASPKVVVRVACDKEDPSIIIGYSILSADFKTIHWLQVKADFRKLGVARSLIPPSPTGVSHLSKLGKALLPKLKDCIFNPFSLS